MAKIKKEEFIESLKELTVLELLELVDAIKEEFGVDPTAVVGNSVSTEEKSTSDEPSSVNIILTEAGPNKIQVIKAIREITGLGLKEAKEIADNGGNIKENVKIDEANELKTKLEETGATIELK